MSILDRVKHMLGGSAKTEELAKQGIDRAQRFAKKRLGPKHARQVDTAAQKAREMAEKIDKPGGTTPPGTTPEPGRTPPSGPSGRDDTTPPPSGP